jgi:hypothetical protein
MGVTGYTPGVRAFEGRGRVTLVKKCLVPAQHLSLRSQFPRDTVQEETDVEFKNTDVDLTTRDIAEVENDLDIRFPDALRIHYLKVNGGDPAPYVYEDERVDTVVSACLPLKSERGQRTAVDTYRHLVLELELVPKTFFPFAVDGGGDYFYVDCSSREGDVYLYRHDTANEPRVNLGIGLDGFWKRLKPE